MPLLEGPRHTLLVRRDLFAEEVEGSVPVHVVAGEAGALVVLNEGLAEHVGRVDDVAESDRRANSPLLASSLETIIPCAR